jgi:signal transduction histidine kinase
MKCAFHRRYWPVWLTLLFGFAGTAWLATGLYQQAAKLDDQRFELEAQGAAALLESSMERYEERLARLADHCSQFDELPTGVWSFRALGMTDLIGNLPAVLHAVYCPKIMPADFQKNARRGRAKWGERYLFNPEQRPNRELALPVWQSWARAGFNPIPRGTDVAGAISELPSLQRGLLHRRGGISAAPARATRSDGSFENGFWFTLALFKLDQKSFPERTPNESAEAFDARRDAFHRKAATGIFGAFISTDRLIDASFNNNPNIPHRLQIRLYASRERKKETLLNPKCPPPLHPRHRMIIPQSWYSQKWSLEFTSTPEFEADTKRFRSALVLAAGFGMTLLASGLLGVALRARGRQEIMTEQIREARDALSAAQEERQRLSHDLHDNTVQTLYAIQLGLNHTGQKLQPHAGEARRELAAVRSELDTVIAEIRCFIAAEENGDKPSDLAAVLRALGQRAEVTTTTRIEVSCDPNAAEKLNGNQAVQLANIAREALSNSLRHGRPNHVRMELRSETDTVHLEISDDGIGFELKSSSRGVGLTSMAARAREGGGEFDIQSSPGKGTRVVIQVPAFGFGEDGVKWSAENQS